MEAAVNVRDKTLFWCALVMEVVTVISCEVGLLGFLLKSFCLYMFALVARHCDL